MAEHQSSELREVTLRALSRCIGTPRGEAPVLECLSRALAQFAHEDAPVGRTTSLAPDPSVPLDGWPTCKQAQRRLGITAAERHGTFVQLKRRRGVDACYSEEFIAHFFPRQLWPVVDRLIGDGPATTVARLNNTLMTMSEREVPGNRRRPAGRVSASYINIIINQFNGLLAAMAALAQEGFDSEHLEGWAVVPKLARPPADSSFTVHAPPTALARSTWEQVHKEARDVLKARSYAQELENIRTLPLSALADHGVWERLRTRTVFALFVLTGGRKGALTRLQREDLIIERHGPAPDNRVGPALVLYPRKRMAATEARAKPLPGELYSVLESWCALVDRFWKAAANDEKGLRSRSRREAVGQDPQYPSSGALVPSGIASTKPMTDESMSGLFSGVVPLGLYRSQPDGPYIVRSGREALIPRPLSEVPEDFLNEVRARLAGDISAMGDEPMPEEDLDALIGSHIGYTPHEFRHLAFQLGQRAGEVWNERHRSSGAEKLPEPDDYGHALLDHAGSGNRLRRIYGDLNAAGAYELLSGRAIEYMWPLLTGELGSRRRPDVDAYADHLDELRAVEQDMGALNDRARRYHAQPVLYGDPEPPVLDALPSGASSEDKLDLLLAQQRRLLDYADRQQRAMGELRHIAVRGNELTFEAVRLSEQRAVLVRTLDELRLNEDTWVTVPDSDRSEPVDWADIERRALGAPVGSLIPVAPLPVRDWLTVIEFAAVAGVNPRATVSRWLAGQVHRDANRRPWDADDVPVCAAAGDRFRRIWVPGVNSEFWSSDTVRQHRDELLSRWPQERGWTDADGGPGRRCLQPLELAGSWGLIHEDAMYDRESDLPELYSGDVELDDDAMTVLDEMVGA